MRGYAEILAAAQATGYYDGPFLQYKGDGFTVPWQTAGLGQIPTSFTLLAYKWYLDARFYECSRIHDWCYTPYGALINVTREEADAAIRDCMKPSSPVDAEIVYRAVRFGGGPYFGTSQTGYVGLLPPPAGANPLPDPQSGPNMGGAFPSVAFGFAPGVSNMPFSKVLLIMQLVTKAGTSMPSVGYSSRAHIGGWSESFWVSGNDPDNIRNIVFSAGGAGGLASLRAACLPKAGSVVGARFYLNGVGKGTFVGQGYPGNQGESDNPQQALQCSGNNLAAPFVRHFTMRGVPDDSIEDGEFSPTPFFASALDTYLFYLGGMYYPSRARATLNDVHDVTAGGLVTFRNASVYAPGTLVKIQGALNSAGARVTGENNVAAVGGLLPNQAQLVNWTEGATTGGQAFQQLPAAFYQIAPSSGTGKCTVERLVTRKVGRPFELYRGRKHKRRK